MFQFICSEKPPSWQEDTVFMILYLHGLIWRVWLERNRSFFKYISLYLKNFWLFFLVAIGLWPKMCIDYRSFHIESFVHCFFFVLLSQENGPMQFLLYLSNELCFLSIQKDINLFLQKKYQHSVKNLNFHSNSQETVIEVFIFECYDKDLTDKANTYLDVHS